jgi:hypothetical protein
MLRAEFPLRGTPNMRRKKRSVDVNSRSGRCCFGAGCPGDMDLYRVFLLGCPIQDDDVPALEREGWETRRVSGSVLCTR